MRTVSIDIIRVCRSLFCSVGLLLLSAILIASCLLGCVESKKTANQDEFVPAKVLPRVERHCSLIRLNGEMGDMSDADPQKLAKELVPPLVERYRQLHVAAKKADAEEGAQDLTSDNNSEAASVTAEEPGIGVAQNPADITCMPKEVADAIRQANIRNYSIFITKINKVYYAIRYFDYVGKNFDVDWMDLERNKTFTQWRNACEECQLPLPADKTEGSAISMLWELNAEEVFYQE